ncbi:DUF3558 family protein [Actinokineospora pegani]|uniref:DUF3558 family protein n=1 Tax=Actinokineospora pegani TaxID=2654637 RepID=UPI0038B372F6
MAVLACAGLLAGCTNSTPGVPTPGLPTATPQDSQVTSVPAPSESDGDLASLDPCTLLSSQARTDFGVTGSGEPDEQPSAKTCEWRAQPAGSTESFAFAVGVFPKLGVDKVNSTGEKTETTVGGR